eukprot:TRINITY_DN52898_c0_g1_i1.p1 TRINITY_DN52898_c0_g1~~TRINITY_DN52898_c0_g1_i1.p1  ORF type:complete len:331 (-),score=62.07 TRINITY_DN52898_c0_g1_i1:165-1157(-)
MYVLGAGSMGCLWTARLAQAGARPTLLLRQGSGKALRCAQGSVKLKIGSPVGNRDLNVSVHVEELTSKDTSKSCPSSSIETLLLLTKAPQAAAALEAIVPRLAPGAVLVLMCNGALAVHERIRELSGLDHTHVVLSTTTHGAWSKADFDVVHAGVGQSWFGRPIGSGLEDGDYFKALRLMGMAGLGETDDGSAILYRLWLKLAANAAINPLTALAEEPNGFVLRSQEARGSLVTVCEEVAAVASASLQGSEAHERLPTAAEMEAFVVKTATDTAENRSSMLQDLLAGRPSEIDYLSGWVVAKGKQLGIETPENARLAALVRQKESATVYK